MGGKMTSGLECSTRNRPGMLLPVLITVVGALGLAQAVHAQDSTASTGDSTADYQNGDMPQLAEITVTGTRIGGGAPVGAALVQLGQAEIAMTGLTSTADILNSVPSILRLGSGDNYAGGQAQQGNTLTSFTYGKSPNIRGLGVGATLSLVNGHRVPYEGGNMNAFDGDNYPTQMIQRIDVVQDGGSSIYGADAIAGTVNYVLRSPEDTFELHSGYRSNDGQDGHYITAIAGLKWGEGSNAEGGFIASYQHSYQDAFEASARADLYNDDLSPFGGPGPSPFSAPGNVVVNGVYYSIPYGQDGTRITLSDLSTTPNYFNTWTGIEVIPEVDADRYALNFTQALGRRVRLFADGLYVYRDFTIRGPNSSTSNRVTSFGALPRIPNSNPYSPCNASHYENGVVTGPPELVAACETGALTVAYSSVYDIGPPTRTGRSETWSFGGGVDISLPADWTLTLSADTGTHDAPSITTQTGGAPAPDFATFNFFCDPTTFQCTDPETAASILARGNSLFNRTRYEMDVYSANISGSLFSVPAGAVKLAAGFERYKGSLLNQNNFGGNNLNTRKVSSVYGELLVPIVSPASDVRGIYQLELNVSGRHDDYSDAGTTTNPRIGVNWWPTSDFKIFGSWGSSFRAPGLADNDPFSQTGVIPGAVSGSQISSAICPACQDPGLATAAIYQAIGGANRDLKPETADTFAIGFEWLPDFVPGLLVSAKYWWISYEGQVGAPAFNVGTVPAINQQLYNSQIIYNPALFPALAANNPVAFFGDFPTINWNNPSCAAVRGQQVTTQELFDAMISCYNTGGETGGLFGAPTPPERVLALVSGRRINAGKTVGKGIDFNVGYRFENGLGVWNLDAVASYTISWKVSPIFGAPLGEEVNEFGFPLTFQTRGHLGWLRRFGFGRLSANAFVNFTNSYEITPQQLPVGVDPAYRHIGSYTTTDLTLTYDTESSFQSWLANNASITLSVQNVFDKDPPLVVNQAGLAGSSTRFDPTYGSPLGRVIQFQISKRF